MVNIPYQNAVKSWLRAGEAAIVGAFQAANKGVALASGPGWGDVRNSWAFNGSGYILVNDGPVLIRSAEWLISATIKAQPATNGIGSLDRVIYCERGSSGNDILKLELRDSIVPTEGNCTRITYRDDAGTLHRHVGDVDVCDGKWHHVGVFRRGNKTTMFVDGRQRTLSATYSGSDTFTDTVEARIGSDVADSNAVLLSGDYVAELILLNRGFPSDPYLIDETPQRVLYSIARGLTGKVVETLPVPSAPAASSFQSAWARGSNVILQPGVLT